MNKEFWFSLITIIIVFTILILITIIMLKDIPLQLEKGFKQYCNDSGGYVYYPINLDCAIGHRYCNVRCTNGISMDEWESNLNWT